MTPAPSGMMYHLTSELHQSAKTVTQWLHPAASCSGLTRASADAEKRHHINNKRVSTDPRIKPEDDDCASRSRVILSVVWYKSPEGVGRPDLGMHRLGSQRH